MVATPIEPRGDVWQRVLKRLRADALDCFQANLAAVADLAYGEGAHLALGAALRFAAVGGPWPTPVVGPSLEQRLADGAELLGLQIEQRWDDVDGKRLRRLSREHPFLYVVADTYTLGWVPYAGRRHMEHSFLLANGGPSWLVVDAYHNATQWGDARPGAWSLSAAELDASVPAASAFALAAHGLPALDAPSVLRANARALDAAVPAIDAYVDAVGGRREDPDAIARLVLDVWTLGRSRRLHAAWLTAAARPGASGVAAAARHADAWLALTAQSYLAMRRAERGAALPVAVIGELATLLHADVALARRLAGADAVDAAAVRAAVRAALREVLDLGEALPVAQRPLRELPGFDSFRLVEIIERIEDRLGLSLDPETLTAESLHSVESLCGLFVHAGHEREP